MKASFIIAVLAITFTACLATHVETKIINIRPGVDEEHTIEHGGGICKFSYKCTGGSSEEWHMDLDDRGGEYHCFITRGSPSYLFFQSFKASLGGREISEVDVLGQDSVLVKDREYIVQQNEVKSTSSYKGGIISGINLRSKFEEELYKDEL